MRTLEAKVLDATHLELSEPIPFGSGQLVEISLNARRKHRASHEATPPEAVGHQPPRRCQEEAWCRSHGDELRAYAGQWVVLEGEEIVAHGEDPTRVLEQADAMGVRVPYIFFVEDRAPGVVQMGL